METCWPKEICHTLGSVVRHRLEHVGYWGSVFTQRSQDFLTLLHYTCVHTAQADHRCSTQRWWRRGIVLEMKQKCSLSGFVRCSSFKIAPSPDSRPGSRGRMKDNARQHRANRMSLEFEGSDNAKVATTAAYRPKQVVVLASVCGDEASVGKHHFGRQQVVKCETMFAHKPA